MTKFSFIMACRNAEDSIRAGVASILAIDETLDIEVVVVDDCSDDDTGRIAHAFARRSPRVRAYENSRIMGIAASRNIAASEAQGEYLFFVDAGEFVSAALMPEVCPLLQECPDVVVVSTFDFDRHGFRSRSTIDSLFAGVRKLASAQEYPACFRDIWCTGKFIGKNFLGQHGLRFDTRGNGADDLLFCSRMWPHARNIRFFHKPLYVRELGYSGLTESDCDEAIAGACALVGLGEVGNGYLGALFEIVRQSAVALGTPLVSDVLKRHFVEFEIPAHDCDVVIAAFAKRCEAGDFTGAVQDAHVAGDGSGGR